MKIGIDISQIVYGTGVSVYTKNLVKSLFEIDRVNQYVLYGGSLRKFSSLKFHFSKENADFESKFYRIPPSLADILWNRIRFGKIELLTGKLDVFHSSDWTQPPTRAFGVTTVHDLAPLKFRRQTHPRIVAVHERRLEIVKREADRVIVPSSSTKVDLVDMGFDEGKIRMIHEAVDERFKPQSVHRINAVKKKFGLNKDYLLMVGTGGRKNTTNIIRAFELLGMSAMQMVFTGNKPDGVGESRSVGFLGYVSEDDLVCLYSGASVLVYASLYEGFGLPVLQGMACGTAVVTSDVSSLPEIAENAAVLVDPNDPGEIKMGIEKALANRDKYVRAGRERVKMFSWRRTALETLEVYGEYAA